MSHSEDIENNLKKIISDTNNKLTNEKNKVEWEKKFAEHAGFIYTNTDYIFNSLKKFRVPEGLCQYIPVSEAKAKDRPITVQLRYLGHIVANVKISNDKIDTLTLTDNNYRSKDGKETLTDINTNKPFDWDSPPAGKIRSFFKYHPEPIHSRPDYKEQEVESVLLTYLESSPKKDKIIKNIQPVKFAGKYRFQMPTALTASEAGTKDTIEYARNTDGGGIDILARRNNTDLCIIEVKNKQDNKSEGPLEAMCQALSYTVFISKLLHSQTANKDELWWKLFFINSHKKEDYDKCRVMPKSLHFQTTVAMPVEDGKTVSDMEKFQKENGNQINTITIPTASGNFDTVELHYIYFNYDRDTQKLDVIESSLGK